MIIYALRCMLFCFNKARFLRFAGYKYHFFARMILLFYIMRKRKIFFTFVKMLDNTEYFMIYLTGKYWDVAKR